MGKPKQYLEPAKNVILVVLFFTTILLMYFFLGYPISADFKISDIIGEKPVEVPSYENVTQPGRIVVHLSRGGYTVLDDQGFNAWDQCLRVLHELKREEIQTVEEITSDQYDQVMEFPSIVFRFHYDMPMASFLEGYSIKKIPEFEQINDFSLIGFSSGSPESLFLYNGSKNKYYRVVHNVAHTSMDELLLLVENQKTVTYFRIGDLVGSENRTMVPLTLNKSMKEMPFSNEFEDLNTPLVKEFAQTFFGESLDFVRKIEESKGTHIYMYGYGEKVLTISADGRVEYRNKEVPQGDQQSYFEALNTAIQYVATHGGWQTAEGMELSPRVRFVQTIENNKQVGYRILFGMQLPDEPIYHSASHSIMVEVIHGQVTQYLRDMIQIDEEVYAESIDGNERVTFSPVNMIAQNYPYIASILTKEGYDFSALEGEAVFDAVSDLILCVRTGYVEPEHEQNGKDVLVPAWVVTVGNVMIYFDLYDAEPLGYTDLLGS